MIGGILPIIGQFLRLAPGNFAARLRQGLSGDNHPETPQRPAPANARSDARPQAVRAGGRKGVTGPDDGLPLADQISHPDQCRP